MPSIMDIRIDPPKILSFGPPGSGKTLFAATGGADVEFIDIDHNMRGCITFNDKWQPERRKVSVIECRDTGTSGGTFLKAKETILNIANACHAKTYKPKVLVVDSLTTLGEHSLRQVMAMSGKQGQQPSLQQWGLAILDIENVLQILRGLPIAVMLLAHQSVEEIDGTNKVTINAIGNKLPRTLPAYFDEIWYHKLVFGAGNTKQFVIQSQPSPAVIARSGGALPDNFDQNRGLTEALGILGYKINEPKDIVQAASA